MKKKMMLSVAAVAMVGTLAVGGTLAWFTDTETVTNVVTTGHVDVKIEEHIPTDEQQTAGGYTATENELGIAYAGIEPGTVIDKDPVITYKGSAPAYVRYKIEIVTEEGSALDVNDIEFLKDEGVVGNLELGEYVYNTTPYDADTEVASPFDQIKFKSTCGNEIADKNLTINIVADAIQADNLIKGEVTEAALKDAFEDAKVEGEIPGFFDDEEVIGSTN